MFSVTPTNSPILWTPDACPTIQLWHHLPRAGVRSHKLKGLWPILLSYHLQIGGSHNLLRFNNLPEWCPERRKRFYLRLPSPGVLSRTWMCSLTQEALEFLQSSISCPQSLAQEAGGWGVELKGPITWSLGVSSDQAPLAPGRPNDKGIRNFKSKMQK